MGFIEALVLLSVGVFAGILSTVFDVLVFGTASFLSHFALWVLLNALVAVHVESRLRAILWAIPFNFGYIESYFVTTVASFECYQKSLLLPLAAVSLISPLLSYALWTAKKEKNVYGRFLSILIVACTLVASYLVNDHLGIYDFVICAILAYVLLAMPVRRLSITRGVRPKDPAAEEAAKEAAEKYGAFAKRGLGKEQKGFSLRRKKKESRHGGHARSSKHFSFASNDAVTEERMDSKPTRRVVQTGSEKPKRFSLMGRRAQKNRENEERERRLRTASEERMRRHSQDDQMDSGMSLPTLGNARQARRSSNHS